MQPPDPRVWGLFAYPPEVLPDVNLDAYITRNQASMLTGVAPSVISHWHARGWLDPDGTRRHLATKRLASGNLLYRVGDILQAEIDTEASSKSRRGVKPRRNWAALNLNSGVAQAS